MIEDTQFSLDDVEYEGSGSAFPRSPNISSPVFSHTPHTHHGYFSFASDHEPTDYVLSENGSPRLNPTYTGSSVPQFSGILHGNTSFVNNLYTSFSGLSHSVPEDSHFLPRGGAMLIPHLNVHDEGDDEDEAEEPNWGRQVMNSQDLPVPQLFVAAVSYSGAAFDSGSNSLNPNHVPSTWASSSIALSRSASSVSNHSFEDFFEPELDMDLDSPSSFLYGDESLRSGAAEEIGWSSNNPTAAIFDPSTPTPSNRAKGRKGRLTEEQRARTAMMRKVGSCSCCRRRKAKCDDGIPCRACRRYFRNRPEELERNPCRGDQLESLAALIMRDNAFPKGGYDRFLPNGNFHIEPQQHGIFLDLGFGSAYFCVQAQLIRADPSVFIHKHVEYPWPPAVGMPARNDKRDDLVFPAIITNLPTVSVDIEAYLGKLIDDRHQFKYFPLWRSELKALRHVYKHYLTIPPHARNPLKQALMLLVLVHVGGELRLVTDELTAGHIINRFFPGVNHRIVKPCFIRAQLGPIFSEMAHNLMKDVLRQLERLSPLNDQLCFPMVISTFAVLVMALESLQYHFEKTAYHCHHDNPEQLSKYQPQYIKLNNEGSDILLRFYKATACHEIVGSLANGLHATSTWPIVSPPAQGRHRNTSVGSYFSHVSEDLAAAEYISSLREHLLEIGPYLDRVVQAGGDVPSGEMSAIFDRLLAQMFTLGPPEVS